MRFPQLGLAGVSLLPEESFRDEVYHMTDADGSTYQWNVALGRQLAQKRGKVIAFYPAEFGITTEHIRGRYPELDEAYAMTCPLARPLLFVPFKGVSQLIDGWHRLFKAVVLGVLELPAYLLTEQEAEAALIGRTPPGQAAPSPRFAAGKLVVTAGALAAIQANGQSPLVLVNRHQAGDWGQMSQEDWATNEVALSQGGRLLSAYTLSDGTTQVWVITESDRSVTTTLLPSEY